MNIIPKRNINCEFKPKDKVYFYCNPKLICLTGTVTEISVSRDKNVFVEIKWDMSQLSCLRENVASSLSSKQGSKYCQFAVAIVPVEQVFASRQECVHYAGVLNSPAYTDNDLQSAVADCQS